MVFDYVRHSTARQRPPKRHGRVVLTIFLILLAIGIPLTMYLIRHVHRVRPAQKEEPPVIEKKSSSAPSKPSVALDNSPEQDHFDFYTLLTKTEVSAPQNVAEAVTHEERYLLQVASLQNPGDAERFKNRIENLGFVTTIQPFRAPNGIVWNRVSAGPYSNLADAERAQSLLYHHSINSILVRVK